MLKNVKARLRSSKLRVDALWYGLVDAVRFSWVGGFSCSLDESILAARILKNFHKIEKGLSLKDRRNYFGQKVISELLRDIYFSLNNYSRSDRLRWIASTALGAIESYTQAHDENEYIKRLKSEVGLIRTDFGLIGATAGVEKLYQKRLSSDEYEAFCSVLGSRKSCREFLRQPLDSQDVLAAISLATTAPSACNRQPWRVHHIKDKILKKSILALQNGNSGFSEEIEELLIICADLSAFISPLERNQAWFDAGLFTMNLSLALHAGGIGSCCLNWCVTRQQDSDLRKLALIPKNEEIVVLLACGYYPDSYAACISPRIPADLITSCT